MVGRPPCCRAEGAQHVKIGHLRRFRFGIARAKTPDFWQHKLEARLIFRAQEEKSKGLQTVVSKPWLEIPDKAEVELRLKKR